MVGTHGGRFGRWVAIALLAMASAVIRAPEAIAQTVAEPSAAPGEPAASDLEMPLVSPEQAALFFATRNVAPSDAPPLSAASAEPIEPLPIEPVLGHELPSEATTPSGMARADFAIAKPDKNKTDKGLGAAIALPAAPDMPVIREEPPAIGKP